MVSKVMVNTKKTHAFGVLGGNPNLVGGWEIMGDRYVTWLHRQALTN